MTSQPKLNSSLGGEGVSITDGGALIEHTLICLLALEKTQKMFLMHNVVFLASSILSTSLFQSMSGKKHIYEAWAGIPLSMKRGCRVINYYLVSTSGRPLLAVVGTEVSNRHYIYAVTEDFLKVFGSSPDVNACTKWTNRRSVMEWLKSLVRKDLPRTNLHNVPTGEGNGGIISISTREPSGAQLLELPPRKQASFQVEDSIELLSEDDDMHECWYRCKILETYKNCWKVQFYDRKNEGGTGNKEDYIRAPKLAPFDKLGMRHSSRLNVRPCPPEEEPPVTFEVGVAVDAWLENNWQEGFVFTRVSLSNSDNYYVFLPGTGKFLIVHRKDLRVSRDWVDDTWVPIKSHPDILSY